MNDLIGRIRVDPSTRRYGAGGRLVLGGSPRRVFRLTADGAALMDRLGAGERLAASPARRSLTDRLVAAGILHPDPPTGAGAFRAADVTVVVPVRDRSDELSRLLRSLGDSGASPARIVVVDDGSADPDLLRATIDAVSTEGDGGRIELVRRPGCGGPAAARNDGLVRVRTPLVAFVDSDCRVTSGWLGPLLAAFDDPHVAIVAPRVHAGPGVPDPPASSRVARSDRWHASILRYETVASPLDLGRHPAEVAAGTRVAYVPSAALVARRDAMEQLGGFDASLRVGEDVDLVWRAVAAGRAVRYVPGSAVIHAVRPSMRAWVSQRFEYGRSAAALDERHPGTVAPVVMSRWSALVWAHVMAGHPWAGAGVAAATTVRSVRALADLPRPVAGGLAVGGHLGVGRQLARASTRAWWPVTLGAAALVPRSRRSVAVGIAVSLVSAWSDSTDRGTIGTGPVRFALLHSIDDAAYGAGVWWGCVERRSFRALRPRLTAPGATSRNG